MNKNITSNEITKLIDEYVKGALDESETDDLWSKLLQHPEYFPLLKTEAGLKKRYLKKAGKHIHKNRSTFRFDKKIPVIIAVAAMFILALFFNLYLRQSGSAIKPPLDEIHHLHLISPEITRSSSDLPSGFDQQLQQAYYLSVSGDSNGAISIYRNLADRDDDAAVNDNIILYNLAILYYNTGDYPSSVETFELIDCSGLMESSRVEFCYWFKTNSYIANGDWDRALEAATRTMENNGIYRQDAADIIKELNNSQLN